jgi:hypothetical protein
MKIQELPNKETLTHFNVQYYNNECGQGSATHVVQVTYSTNPDPIKARQKHHQRAVKFNLKTENKAINRLVKDHLGEDAKEEVKATIKELKKVAGITACFGFRRVQYALKHKFVKGAIFHKNTIDPTTYVYWLVLPDNTSLMRFMWAGQVIDVPMIEQANPVPNQSLMYAYWSPSVTEEELKQHLEDMKHEKQTRSATAHEEVSDARHYAQGTSICEPCTESADAYADTGRSSQESSDQSILQSEETSGRTGAESKTQCSNPETEQLEVADSGRDGEASRLGDNDQESAARTIDKRREGTAKRVQRRKAFDDNPFAGTPYDTGWMVDRQPESPFAPQFANVDTDLGTSIRL